MTSRTRPVHLTIAEKHDILEMRKKSESRQSALEKYGISMATLLRIYAQSERIKKEFESDVELSQFEKRLTTRKLDIDSIVHQWYLRCKERNVQITGAEIQKRALEINMKLEGSLQFKTGRAWLQRFKERFNITNADIRENVKAKTEIATAGFFTADFNRFLLQRQITLRNVYNVVYTPIMWKVLPEGTCVMKRAKSSENLEMCEDYVIALLCANATGNRKLPVLLIGTDPDVHALQNFDRESLIYKSKANVSMDSTIFKEWYKDYFLESVKERQRENACNEQYLLLLDNAMSLHNLDDLNNLYQFVTVMSPPVDVSPLRLPMNCGVISCLKRKYRMDLLKATKPSTTSVTEQDMIDMYKEISMWDCCRFIHNAWSSVDDVTLISAWNCILTFGNTPITCADEWDDDMEEVLKIMRQLPGCEECEEVDVYNWFYAENQYDIVKKKCVDEVIREFEDNCSDIVDDVPGPSCAKLPRRS